MQPGDTNFRSEAGARSLADRAAPPHRASETTRAHDFFGEPFRPRRTFIGGHAQTLAGNFLPRRNQLPAAEERLFSVEADVQVLCHCHWQADRARTMTLVIVHGREGMNVVRMNMRNCGGTEKLGPTLYNSGMSADVGAVAKTLIEQDGLQKLAFAGFSMGGNMVLKLLGEWGDQAPPQVKAAVGISPAIDLAVSADALHDPANRLYEMKFLWGLCRRIQRKAALYPEHFEVRHLRGVRSLRDFDDQITARYCGFLDAQDYYTRAASARVLERIAVPALVIHAEDDPFIRILPETRDKLLRNPH